MCTTNLNTYSTLLTSPNLTSLIKTGLWYYKLSWQRSIAYWQQLDVWLIILSMNISKLPPLICAPALRPVMHLLIYDLSHLPHQFAESLKTNATTILLITIKEDNKTILLSIMLSFLAKHPITNAHPVQIQHKSNSVEKQALVILLANSIHNHCLNPKFTRNQTLRFSTQLLEK